MVFDTQKLKKKFRATVSASQKARMSAERGFGKFKKGVASVNRGIDTLQMKARSRDVLFSSKQKEFLLGKRKR